MRVVRRRLLLFSPIQRLLSLRGREVCVGLRGERVRGMQRRQVFAGIRCGTLELHRLRGRPVPAVVKPGSLHRLRDRSVPVNVR